MKKLNHSTDDQESYLQKRKSVESFTIVSNIEIKCIVKFSFSAV